MTDTVFDKFADAEVPDDWIDPRPKFVAMTRDGMMWGAGYEQMDAHSDGQKSLLHSLGLEDYDWENPELELRVYFASEPLYTYVLLDGWDEKMTKKLYMENGILHYQGEREGYGDKARAIIQKAEEEFPPYKTVLWPLGG